MKFLAFVLVFIYCKGILVLLRSKLIWIVVEDVSVSCQTTLPPMDGMSEMDNSNMSLIVSTLDEACLANSTEEDNVVYVGAIAVSDTLL